MGTVGFVGLGKLGLPCALTLDAYSDYRVVGYDVSDRPTRILFGDEEPPVERHIKDLLAKTKMTIVESAKQVVAATDGVVFVAVQTPHDEEYGGEKPMPFDRRDFEYQYLVEACKTVCAEAATQNKEITLVVISTVLPGTMDRCIRPVMNKNVRLVYSPLFIAMGTVVDDYLNPEMILMGSDSVDYCEPVRAVYSSMTDRPQVLISIPSAELAKVTYNTFISTKVVFANTVMEMAHKTGADCDEVHQALTMATDRVVSPRYMKGGMGDGGACHPRDLIAMSWLARHLDLSWDFMGELVYAREAQTQWMAGVVKTWAERTKLPVCILGKAYKKGLTLTNGSAALLLEHYLKEQEVQVDMWDPHTDEPPIHGHYQENQYVFVIGANHDEFATMEFATGSIVIDPWGYIPDQEGVTVIRVGRKG